MFQRYLIYENTINWLVIYVVNGKYLKKYLLEQEVSYYGNEN